MFATSIGPVQYQGRNNVSSASEDEMMEQRWKMYEFTHQIPPEEQKDIPPCARCFSTLVLLGRL